MKKNKSIILWIIAIVFTLSIAFFQRITGPTQNIKGKFVINNSPVSYTLPRTSDNENGEKVSIKVKDTTVTGFMKFKRYKSNDYLTISPLVREGEYLTVVIPPQPPAGKVMYRITLEGNGVKYKLTDNWVVIRFKGMVPASILIPHIILMFLAMLFSTRTGLEAIFKGFKTYRYSFVTLVSLFIGGGILGPIVQKYAFGAYWTGWPFGHDLTDNKTLVAIIFWMFAFYKLAKNRENRKWAVIAAVILLAVYLIPHSALGSEIDYTKVP